MKRDAYKFMRRFMHFADNYLRKKPYKEGYDRLFKVSHVIDEVLKGIHHTWKAGKRVTVDESMIKYMNRTVPYVQYMPAKPIKHGIYPTSKNIGESFQ